MASAGEARSLTLFARRGRTMSFRRNVIANYLGQAWVALMGLAFIPIYIRYLGIEAWGLMGLFALLQACLTLLDAGVTPTLGREMARFTAGEQSPQAIRDLLRTLESVCHRHGNPGRSRGVGIIRLAGERLAEGRQAAHRRGSARHLDHGAAGRAAIRRKHLQERSVRPAAAGVDQWRQCGAGHAARCRCRADPGGGFADHRGVLSVAGADLRAVGDVPGKRRSSHLAPGARQVLAGHAAAGLALCQRHDRHHAAGAAADSGRQAAAVPLAHPAGVRLLLAWPRWWPVRCTC